MKKPKIFLDSTVLFSACVSESGASREIIRWGMRAKVEIILSDLVLLEVRRNLKQKHPQGLLYLQQIEDNLLYFLVIPTLENIREAQTYTEFKDAPIVAAAKQAQVDFLASFDRKHLVGVEAVSQRVKFPIMLPAQVLWEIRTNE